jgi:flagellar basal body-associated protein FliL
MAKGKVDNSKQGKAETFVDGWAATSNRLLIIAIIVLVAVIALTFLISFFSNNKYFPRQPSRKQIQMQRVLQDVKRFHNPPFFKR